ncbi:hypothetical protein [Phytohabitans rumicis]|uniref:hypothetical protein n=1 Tax=Phytohabitans rumicis TaxID=1076125 RepID=UPI00156300BC|nr:hypothetical protein [Phytohabitans rumicis]
MAVDKTKPTAMPPHIVHLQAGILRLLVAPQQIHRVAAPADSQLRSATHRYAEWLTGQALVTHFSLP